MLQRIQDEEAIDKEDNHIPIVEKILEVVKEVSDLIFRENKTLYPALWTLLSKGEWVAIKNESYKIEYIKNLHTDKEWISYERAIFPYEVEISLVPDHLEKLLREIRSILSKVELKPDTYKLIRKNDLDVGTGYLKVEEIEALFRSLPIEITFIGTDDRVRFYSESMLLQGFIRTNTLLGRKAEFCHPLRLEEFVRKVVNELKKGIKDYEIFWTKAGGRVLRVMIVAVKSEKGECLGAVEVVEDFTNIIKNLEEIEKKVIVL